jgi:hypothetical protein
MQQVSMIFIMNIARDKCCICKYRYRQRIRFTYLEQNAISGMPLLFRKDTLHIGVRGGAHCLKQKGQAKETKDNKKARL